MDECLDEYLDEELMVMIQDRHHEAFAVLVRRHTERFYALAYKTLFNQAEAEDIVQECFLKVWNKPAIWKRSKNTRFTTWFYRIIANACYDHNKKKSSIGHLSTDWSSTELDQVEASRSNPENEVFLSEVEKAMIQLPQRQRTAVALCFLEGLSNQEAADVLGVRLKALQSLLMRGKETLKATLGIPLKKSAENKKVKS